MSFNIAIDGPAGAGKSTIAKQLAKKLAMIYVDTGAMYRTIGLYVLKEVDFLPDSVNEINDKHIEKIGLFLETHLEYIHIHLEYSDAGQHIFLNDEDVSNMIRTPEMGKMASIVSSFKHVRLFGISLQQKLAKETSVIMDGRDIGTMVLPNAELKIYLTASSHVRAKRRYDEMVEKGVSVDIKQLEKEIEERDYRDMNREYAPLKKAEDAVEVDTSNMNIDEVVDELYRLAIEKQV